jgi:hypothetical protein
MPSPTRTVRWSVLTVGAVLVTTVLVLPYSAAANDDPAGQPPPSYAGHLARAGETDQGNPGYHYAAAHTQVLATPADGLRATLSVHKPRQVRGRVGQHSLGQIAVGHTRDSSYLEAGWRQHLGEPRLFVYWRPADGGETCYNFGCGFRPKGTGIRPGSQLTPGTELTVAFQHVDNRWWLKINGERTGYFPDRLWGGRFQGTDFAQVYGEVFASEGQRVCADMGNGRPARNRHAAYARDVGWIRGPPMQLRKATTVREVHNYGYRQTSDSSFRYGGPGAC